MAKFINPFSDWGFKRIFGQDISKDLLIDFLNNLFEGELVIKSISFKNNEQIGLTEDSRGIIFDIYCTTSNDENIIIEMQNRSQTYFIDRALYYTSRVIVNQGEKGEWDYKLTPVYTICFMNFIDKNLNNEKFRADLILADKDTGRKVSDKIRITYLMLPLFNKNEDECSNNFDKWIFILKNMAVFERMPFMAKNAVFRKLAEISDITALSKDEQEKYGESLKILRDNYAIYKAAEKEGEDRARYSMASKLLSKGFDIKDICEITGLSINDIKNLN